MASDRELEELKERSRASWDGAPDYRVLAAKIEPAAVQCTRSGERRIGTLTRSCCVESAYQYGPAR